MTIAVSRPFRWLRARTSRWLTLVVVVLLAAGAVTWLVLTSGDGFSTRERMLTVQSGPTGTEPVTLDTTLYVPDGAGAGSPAPAVLLAHGFGGDKNSVRAAAKDLARRGYVVLAFSARGFGRSSGEIHLDSPDYEVNDARRLIDHLASLPEVRKDAKGDPRVGAVGGSYGGALALLLAAYDKRVDTIVPQITWHNLSDALFPEATGAGPTRGVFKKLWAGLFFGAGTENGEPDDPSCGRFAREVCDVYLQAAASGTPTPQAVALLWRSSPMSVLSEIKAPTLLVQGTVDSLFPLSEADKNARGIAATGTPVRVTWFNGGHDGGVGPRSDVDRVKDLTGKWLDRYLRGKGAKPGKSFTYSRVAGIDAANRDVATVAYSVDKYPGLGGDTKSDDVPLTGAPTKIANPPGGTPAAISSLPLTGLASSLTTGITRDIGGQHATFSSRPLPRSVDVVGAPQVRLRAASPTGEAVLFVKLYDVDDNGQATLPAGLVAPVRLGGLPANIDAARPVTVTLPAIAHRFEAGHRLRLVVATSDQGYASPAQPVVYTVGIGQPGEGAAVALPRVDAAPLTNPDAVWRVVLVVVVAALVLLALVAVVVARLRRRRTSRDVVDPDSDTPLVVRGLRKEYADGFVAVRDISFTVEPNQVVGLLGPNGAGKTTTLRVLLGLTRPSEGEALIFGHHLVPGAAVLSRVGALVEGPGFLPHLSGMENLRLYWAATGRPWVDARLDGVLEIAGLGAAIDRKVRTYSHGMKQRLAIAQAMLGMPRLLILDEPTDGLDPPQIAQMRRVLNAYARDGRSVLVSSHLLAEVEQTCTHVVVVHKGRKVAEGPVAEIVGDSPSVFVEVSDVGAAESVLEDLDGVSSVQRDGKGLVVELTSTSRATVVAALVTSGVDVDRVVPRRRLEDAFLALVGGE